MVLTRRSRLNKMRQRISVPPPSAVEGEQNPKPTEIIRNAKHKSNSTVLHNEAKTIKVQIVKKKKATKKKATAMVPTVTLTMTPTVTSSLISGTDTLIAEPKSPSKQKQVPVKQEETTMAKKETPTKKEKQTKKGKSVAAKEQKGNVIEQTESTEIKEEKHSGKITRRGGIVKEVPLLQNHTDDSIGARKNNQEKKISAHTNTLSLKIIKKSQKKTSNKGKGRKRGRPSITKTSNETNLNTIGNSDENHINITKYEIKQEEEVDKQTEENKKGYFSWLWKLVPKLRG